MATYIRFKSENEISECFILPHTMVKTTGIGNGFILRFKTFYLKMYPNEKIASTYTVEGYRYNEGIPVFKDCIRLNDIKSYALRFTKEDYLNSFCEPC